MSGGTIAGSLVSLFLYDVGEAIRLDELRQTLGSPPPGREPPFRQPAPDYVQFEKPPVIEPLPAGSVKDGRQFAGRLAYYDYGVVTVQFEMRFEGTWQEIIELAARWMNAPELEQKAVATVRSCCGKTAGAIVNPYEEYLDEDYCIVHLHTVRDEQGKPVTAHELIERWPDHIAQIVRGETATFSATERAEILESRMSYYENDLLVVGWSAALIYDTAEGAAPTIRLLEYANTQLLEFRHYDSLLTARLSEVYRSLE